MNSFDPIIDEIKSLYGADRDFIPLHEPLFVGNEKKYLNDCIDSTFVSSVGEYVNRFEKMMVDYTGAKHAIAVVNGTAGLHLALVIAGVQSNDIVVSQAVSFVATANAIAYTGATPYFVDSDLDTLGMSPDALRRFFNQVEMIDGEAIYTPTGQRVAAVVPMHTFGFPVRIDEIKDICDEFGVDLVEDAAESLGSTYKGKHTGTFGAVGVYSFNGNKTITCGGGGILVTNDDALAKKAKHLSTQAKIPHPWEYQHDALGYNYRCPNINAALACAQLENLDRFIDNKRETAARYQSFFENREEKFISEPKDSRSNYWLNAIIFPKAADRDAFLKQTNTNGVMTRPIWSLLNKQNYLPNVLHDALQNSIFIEQHLVNIPSSVRL